MKIERNQIEIMRAAGCCYPYFEFAPAWLKYCDTITDCDSKLNFIRCITRYALAEEMPDLSGELLDYFNSTIRPNLDRQHAKIRKQLERYGYEQ